VAAQTANFTPAQISALSPTQIRGLTPAQLNALSPAKIAGLSQAQTQALTPTQLDGLSTASLNAVNVANLSAATVSGLTTKTLSALSATQTASLLANQADKLSVAQISSLSASQLSTTMLVGAANGLRFNLSWRSSVANAPAGYRNAAIAAAAGLSANFSNKVVVNVQIGDGEVAGHAIPTGNAAESASYLNSVSYSGLYAALQKDASNSTIQAK